MPHNNVKTTQRMFFSSKDGKLIFCQGGRGLL